MGVMQMKYRYLLVFGMLAIAAQSAIAERMIPGEGGINRNMNNNNGYINNNNGNMNNRNDNYVVVPYNVGQPVPNQPMTTIEGPNGTTQTQIGNTTYYSPGASSVTNGNKTIYSDGTTCSVQNNKRVCN